MILCEVCSIEKLENEAKHLIWPENFLTPLNFWVWVFAGINSEQKADTSTTITMMQCICVQLGESITTEVA